MNVYDLTDGQDPMTHAEIDCLRDLAAGLPPSSVIVNIGAAAGLSTIAFLEGCPTGVIYSVDVDECPQEFDNAAKCGVDTARIIRVLGRSEEIGQAFSLKCDLLFVDGGHFNAGADIDAWRDKVKPGGVIAFHDYMEHCPPNNPGSVYKDVNEHFDEGEAIIRVDRVIAFRLMK